MENQNCSNLNAHEMPTFSFKNEHTHPLGKADEDSTSSIVSDNTEDDSPEHFVTSARIDNLPQQNLPSNNISIEKSSDILVGSKIQFNGNVVIQNFVAGNEGQSQFVSNQNLRTLHEPLSAQQTADNSWFRSLITYISCKSKWIVRILALICVLAVLGSFAVTAYFLYLHFGVYTVAGALFVCKTIDSSVCYIGSSTTSCSNVVSADGRPYISGHTTSGLCKIYSRQGCQGNVQEIETDHVKFLFEALSARC